MQYCCITSFSPVLHQLTFLEIKLLHSITEELFLCQTGSRALPEVCMSSRRPQNWIFFKRKPFLYYFIYVFLYFILSLCIIFKSVSFYFICTISYYKPLEEEGSGRLNIRQNSFHCLSSLSFSHLYLKIYSWSDLYQDPVADGNFCVWAKRDAC